MSARIRFTRTARLNASSDIRATPAKIFNPVIPLSALADFRAMYMTKMKMAQFLISDGEIERDVLGAHSIMLLRQALL
jgi:hypothetical protein